MGIFRSKVSDETKAELKMAKNIAKAKSFAEMCAVSGYTHEEHTVVTADGYLLLLQRILPKCSLEEEDRRKRPVVYIQHGLLTNSELFMTVCNPKRCLPFVLVDNGYDVWLGNNRGNKYSRRHTTLSTSSREFWDFSIDDFASFDIPSSVSFVLNHAGAQKLSYVGFSQGSAQAFAALSTNKELNDKLDVFIALAPIMRPRGYALKYIDNAVKINPFSIQPFFGHKSMFPSVSFFQTHLPTMILNFSVDVALIHLLAYYNHNIPTAQKIAGYPHMYCASSVKTVVHWAQIMKEGVFVKFQPKRSPVVDLEARRYPTESITTRIVLIHGDRDILFDLAPVLEHLPKGVQSVKLEGYEHLDVLWGGNVDVDVIPRVLEALPAVVS